MSLNGLSGQLEEFLDRARAALSEEVTGAHKIVAALNAEKAAAQATLAELQDQRTQAQKQLDAVLSDLGRASGLVGLNSEIKKARATLEGLKGETAEATKALEKLAKERNESEAKLVALGSEAQRMIAIRVEGEAVMANLRAQLQRVQIGRP